jgi:hypothetical protein
MSDVPADYSDPASETDVLMSASAFIATEASSFSGSMNVVHESACRALQDLEATSPDSAQDGASIWKKAKSLNPTLSVPESTFITYLCKLAQDDRSAISCEGRKQGYFFAAEAQRLTEASQPADNGETEKDKKRIEREKLLYPVLIEWARSRGYRADDLSRGTAMGKWGNPDVVGIDLTEHLGSLSLEILTIEAKASHSLWEMWIFECVSHRRFANRAYFAFVYPQDLLSKEFGEMRYYAELFGVGLLVLGVKNEVLEKLRNGELGAPLRSDEVDIRELYSAPHHAVPLKQQKRFCHRAMGCPDIMSLSNWGEKPIGDNE